MYFAEKSFDKESIALPMFAFLYIVCNWTGNRNLLSELKAFINIFVIVAHAGVKFFVTIAARFLESQSAHLPGYD